MLNFPELEKFNPALAYTYEAEKMIDETDEMAATHPYEWINSIIEQQKDIYNALLYAQNEILPQLEHGFNALTPEQFLDWIKKIHQIGSHALITKMNLRTPEPIRVQPGEYAKDLVARWKHGNTFQIDIYIFFKDSNAKFNPFFYQMKEKYPLENRSDFKQFIELLARLRDDEDMDLHLRMHNDKKVFEYRDIQSDYATGTEIMRKLHVAYHENLLSAAEKALVDQFVALPIPPGKIEAAMYEYATQSLTLLNNCDPHNLVAISETLAEIFYGLTGRHPFNNGDGRTAMILVNSFAVAMHQPSFLIRYPDEKDNPNSEYSRAFENITQTRQPLANLILSRLTTVYVNEAAKKLFQERCALIHSCTQFNQVKPYDLDANQILQIIIKEFMKAKIDKNPENFAVYAVENFSSTTLGLITQSFDTKILFIKRKIEQITGLGSDKWVFKKDKSLAENPIVILSFEDDAQQVVAKQYAEILSKTKAMDLLCSVRTDDKTTSVLMLTKFKYIELFNYVPEVAVKPTITEQASLSVKP